MEMRQAGNDRMFSLDLLRGLDMFYLAVVSPILLALFKALDAEPG